MKHLKNINGRWKVRLRVPDDCREKLGRIEFIKSLGPISRSEAETEAHFLLSNWKRKILEARRSYLSPLILDDVPDAIRKITRERIEDAVKDHEKWIADDDDLEDLYIRYATTSAVGSGLVPDNSQRSRDAVAEALHYYCVPSNHLDEYISIKLRDLKQRSQDEHSSILIKEMFRAFPRIGQEFDRYKVVKWWESYQLRTTPPAASTLRKYLSHITSYMKWLISKGYTNKPNYFADLEPISKRQAVRKRRLPERKPFRDEEVTRIFRAINETPRPDSLRTLFLIALYTGCRIEEICRLTASDIQKSESGLYYIDIPESKTQKGEHRLVPVHPEILGLVLNKSGYLVELGEIKNKYGERSGPIGKKFSRIKTKLGFGPDKVFHSLRKTFIDKLKTIDTPEVIAADIVGHEVGTMTYGVYASGAPVEKLFSYISKVRYPELEELIGNSA